MTPVKLRLDNVVKRFGGSGGAQTTAVEDLTLDVAAGEFLVIVGPSGCGKTTVLNLLAGLELPTTGTVALDGRTIRGPGPERGVMFQDYGLFPWHTVRGNVEFGLRHGPAGASLDVAARKRRVQSTIELVGLAGAENKYPHQLSGGMPDCERRGISVLMAAPFNSGILATGARPGATYFYTGADAEIMPARRASESNSPL